MGRWARAFSALFLAMTIVGLVVVAPATAANRSDGPLVGTHVHALWSHYDDDLRARVLDELAAAGVRSIRVDIGWTSLMEQCRGCISDWYVKRLDRVVTQAEARGMDVLGVLWRTPSWANGGDLLAPPHDPADYGRAAGWLADRFEGRITAWELWNEPNLDDYFHGTIDDYVELVRAASPAIRAADPSATIVLGGPAHNDSGWIDKVLQRGVAPLVDVVAVHPYTTPSDDPPTLDDPNGDIGRFAHLTTVIDVVNRHAPGKPVWVTEFGWSSHATQAGAPLWKRGVTRTQQAQYTVEALELLRDRWPQVERAYVFRALDRTTGNLHLDNFGLLDVDAKPKPVAHELRRLLVPPDGSAPPPSNGQPSAVIRDGAWHLRETPGGGAPDVTFKYGHTSDLPFFGDWNGDGTATPGVYRNGRWLLRNTNRGGAADISFYYGGHRGDFPVVGDWNGDGIDTVGIIRGGEWHLVNSHRGGSADLRFTYGRIGPRGDDFPLVGDWDGDGTDTAGIVREGEWHLRNSNTGGPGQIVFTYGRVGPRGDDVPIIGDWNNNGTDTVGIVRGSDWYLRSRNAGGSADWVYRYGRTEDWKSVVGGFADTTQAARG